MKNENFSKKVRLSILVSMLLSSNIYAGKIMTDANLSNIIVTENKQFGFKGLNFNNLDVRIVDIQDFMGDLGEFNTLTGIYSGLGVDMSFETDIYNSDKDTILGHLHGKDWPVGEPSGIKVINDDIQVKHGKPYNCIMTSSYQDGAYLDTFPTQPNPVICSSDWQTHKRFKINMLPSSVVNLDLEGYGQPIDLVFNLDSMDTDTMARRYQVLQKINNYTNVRLDGYKVEVLNSLGEKVPELTLSLGVGEGDKGDIWKETEMATMSHGLWGEYEEDRFENGFFDYKTVYYPVKLSEDNQTISYIGNIQGGNYQEIFGNWIPSIWSPTGMFWDDDANPDTDSKLKAFYGTPPNETELAWWKSVVTDDPTDTINPIYTWEKVTASEYATWIGDGYQEGEIEDVLNLGINYIINVGENTKIGDTFILRVRPHVSSDTSIPTYVDQEIVYPVEEEDTNVVDTNDVDTNDGEEAIVSSGGGGGCSTNPNNNFDYSFLFLMGISLLYPFRKKLIK